MDRHGELSNDPTRRVLVHIDVFSDPPEQEGPPKTLREWISRILHPTPTKPREAEPAALAALWRWAEKRGVTLEAFGTGIDQKVIDQFLEDIDRKQSHPFRAGHVFPTAVSLADELPYRRDLAGVIDIPQRGMHYGSWWIDPRSTY